MTQDLNNLKKHSQNVRTYFPVSYLDFILGSKLKLPMISHLKSPEQPHVVAENELSVLVRLVGKSPKASCWSVSTQSCIIYWIITSVLINISIYLLTNPVQELCALTCSRLRSKPLEKLKYACGVFTTFFTNYPFPNSD